MSSVLLLALALACPQDSALPEQVPSSRARDVAAYAHDEYGAAAIQTLGDLVAFDTFERPGVPNAEQPSFRRMTAYLESLAGQLGLDFADHGAVVVIGLGDAERRLGVVTHGDVQPADPEKWAQSPFVLDTESEPGRLVGRGAEDDKGPIACTLFALGAIRAKAVPLQRRIELIVSYTEESDWAAFQEYLTNHPPPELNVAFDAEYPVVVAEKGWCSVEVSFPFAGAGDVPDAPSLASFTGGFFLSQVPEDAEALILHPDPELEAQLLAAARADAAARFEFLPAPDRLTIRAHGISAHSSTPEEGVNAITHLGQLLAVHDWPANGAGWMVAFLRDRVGTGHLAERFGEVAYEHPFMGPLTLSFGTLKEEGGRLVGAINLRRPAGRSEADVRDAITAAIESWKAESGCRDVEYSSYIGAPHLPVEPPHVPVLLDTFRAYTGIAAAEPISIGGGTHARLLPYGVNFGPAMPGETYTGHTEHEFLTREQFLLNLRMYTSLLVDLAAE